MGVIGLVGVLGFGAWGLEGVGFRVIGFIRTA